MTCPTRSQCNGPRKHRRNASHTPLPINCNIVILEQATSERVEIVMAEAEEATAALLNEDSEDEVDPSFVVSEDDLYPLEVAAKAARTHGSTVPQVKYPSN